jgi:hypothetical protein
MYQGRIRHFSPHVIGWGSDGAGSVVGYQYAGESSGPLPADGEWQCFRVDGLTSVSANSDRWYTRTDQSRPTDCVTKVDVQMGW